MNLRSLILTFSLVHAICVFQGGKAEDDDYQAEDGGKKVKAKMDPALCGNGVKDPGEECDCGSADKCLQDPCCHSTCHLKLHAQCSDDDPCCSGCRFKSAGTVCKSTRNGGCDVTEYCNGTSAECQHATYRRNGANCTDVQGFVGVCYVGECKPFHEPCQDDWKTLETGPIKEKSKCLGNMVCVNNTCTKLLDLPHSKPCSTDDHGLECSGNGICTTLGCYCFMNWTGSDCSVVKVITLEDDKPGKMKGLGPEQTDSTSNTPLLVGGLVTFVVVVSIFFVVSAFKFIPARVPKASSNIGMVYPNAHLETGSGDHHHHTNGPRQTSNSRNANGPDSDPFDDVEIAKPLALDPSP